MQSKCNQNAVKMQQKCSQNSVKAQAKFSQNAVKMQPKCNQTSGKIQSGLGIAYRLKNFQTCYLKARFNQFLNIFRSLQKEPAQSPLLTSPFLHYTFCIVNEGPVMESFDK